MFTEIPTYITPVLNLLENAGYEAYLVGGCVRDRAMGKTPNDYDITTNAKPHEMQNVFCDYRVIETGLKHGTLTVVSEGECVEITTYRIDGEYADNRHPTEVSFTDDITLDLSRRDFTVNAMAYSRTLGLCDPFGGMAHLIEKRIVCVGSPEARFNEDGLRILRALRFASVLDFEIDEATSEAVHSLSHLLRGISKERIYTELTKLLCGAGVTRILSGYGDVLAVCADGIDSETFSHCACDIAALPSGDAVARLAYLCRSASDSADLSPREHAASCMKGLKTSTADMRRCTALAEIMGEDFPETDADIKRLMGRFDERDIKTYADLRGVYTKNAYAAEIFIKRYEIIAATDPCVKIADLDITGNDIIRITGKKGTEVGKTLALLLEEVITERLSNTREALEAELALMGEERLK